MELFLVVYPQCFFYPPGSLNLTWLYLTINDSSGKWHEGPIVRMLINHQAIIIPLAWE